MLYTKQIKVKNQYLKSIFKILCYLQSEETWVIVPQKQYMFAKKYHLYWIAGRANILSKYITFLNFGHGFCSSFPIYFQKLHLLVVKKFFCCILLLYLWAQKVFQIFKILFQSGDINIFVYRGVFFSRYVQLKSLFSDKKKILVVKSN